MREFTKDEIKNIFGKANSLVISIEVLYLSGIYAFDVLKRTYSKKKLSVEITHYSNGLVFEAKGGWEKKRTAIKYSSINYAFLEHQNNIQYQNGSTVIGGAILGGLILGPLGAVVGGMSGIGNKLNLNSDPDNILTICYQDGERERFFVFGVYNTIYKYVDDFCKKLGSKYKSSSELAKMLSSSKLQVQKPVEMNIAEQILKLKELLDAGALSEEEFKLAKSKLLK